MKVCLKCDDCYNSSDWCCPSCGYTPVTLNGFLSHSPEHSFHGGGFKPEYFSKLSDLEEKNFWFRARNNIILWALETYQKDAKTILEVGCGTGFVLSGIANTTPDASLTGSEIFLEGLPFASKRVPKASFMQMDARRIPFYEEFDVIGAFDVLEHIEEDKVVLSQLHKALKPGGVLLLTVPQHPWLWSTADEYACHVRRYTKKDIEDKVVINNFVIERSTSFVNLLLPAMLASRRKKLKKENYNVENELCIPRLINESFYFIMCIEKNMIQLGFNFSFGGSRLIIARKI